MKPLREELHHSVTLREDPQRGRPVQPGLLEVDDDEAQATAGHCTLFHQPVRFDTTELQVIRVTRPTSTHLRLVPMTRQRSALEADRQSLSHRSCLILRGGLTTGLEGSYHEPYTSLTTS